MLRRLLFWSHLATGLAVGVIVFVMSVTGVLLAYQKQMQAWADRRAVGVVAAPAVALPMDTLVARARTAARAMPAARPAAEGARGGGKPAEATAVTVRRANPGVVEVAFGRERTLWVRAADGAVLGEGGVGTRRFFQKVTELHRWLALSGPRREWGAAVTGAANLGFLLLVLSGLWLWLPRRWTATAVRQVAWFRGGLRGRARDFNWHNTIGLWTALPLVVVVASGVVISYEWASDLAFRAAGEAPPPRPPEGGAGGAAPGAGGGERGGRPGAPGVRSDAGATGAVAAAPATIALDTAVARAQGRMPAWRIVAVTLPKKADTTLAVSVDAGFGGEPQKRAQLVLDRATGAERQWKPFTANGPGRRLRTILRFAHTGEVLGVPGQTIALLASLGGAVLVVTGISLSARRWEAWRGRRSRVAETPAVARAA